MLHSRFFWKLYAGYTAVILVSIAVVGTLISQKIERDTLEEIRRSLQARAIFLKELASPHLEIFQDSTFQSRVQTLGLAMDTRLTVMKENGEVINNINKKSTELKIFQTLRYPKHSLN